MQKQTNITVSIKSGFCFLIASSVLIVPIHWVASWLLAAIVHELSHYIALKICHIHIYSVKIDHTGAFIRTDNIPPSKEFICAIAGPIGSLSLCLLSKFIPLASFCALIQGIYNLIPLYPFDGGRALLALLTITVGQDKGHRIMTYFELIFVTLLLLFCGWLTISFRLKAFPLILSLLLITRLIKIKFSCKPGKQIVQ